MHMLVPCSYLIYPLISSLQGPLNKAQGFAVPLKMFAKHVHEGQPKLWTYLEDELFIEMNPELREDLRQPVSMYVNFNVIF